MILYKRDSTGAIRQWTVEISGDKYRTIAGAHGGKQVVSDWTTVSTKNAGKANEISGASQAFKEVSAMFTKKKKEGYFDSIADIDKSTLIKPMLAHNYEDHRGHGFPVYVQPKLDGFRCNATRDGLFSRRGEKFESCPHIEAALKDFFATEGYVSNRPLDGELYNHDLKEDFNSLQSLITKKNPSKAHLDETAEKVQYYIYDVVDPAHPFSTRDSMRFEVAKDGLRENIPDCIKFVPTYLCHTQEEVDKYYEQFLEAGYEGQMVRLNEPYQNKRSNSLLKRKEFQDAEFKVVGVEEGLGNRSGMAGRITCELPDGRQFGAGIKGGIVVNKQLWTDKDTLPGQLATITFFNYTPDGIPRFPVFKSIRTDI